MIRIAFITNYIVKGGPSAVIINLITNLDSAKYIPILVTVFNGDDEQIVSNLKSQGIQVIQCKYQSRVKYLLAGKKKLEDLICDNHVQIVHTHGFIEDLALARAKTSAKRISTIHSVVFEDYAFEYGKFKGFIYLQVQMHALKKLDYVICCANSVQKAMKKYLPNCGCVRNGLPIIETTKFISKREQQIPRDSTVYLFVGRLEARKNVCFLVQQFVENHMNDEYLLVLGEGTQRQQCEVLADNHVRFLGFLEDPHPYYEMADIYISASKSEGFSISVIEALSHGLGLLLSDIPSHNELFEIDKSVYLGETFKTAEFSLAIQRLRAHYSSADKASIKSFAEKHLTAIKMAKEYSAYYEKILGKESRRWR